MTIKQISILLENRPGKLSEVSELLGKEGINIGGFCLSESTDRSIVRLITDNPDKTLRVLKNAGYSPWESDVVAVVTPDHPGGLNAVLKPLSLGGVNVNYLFPHLKMVDDNAVIIFRVDNTEKAIEILRSNWIQIVGEDLYSI